MKGSYLISYSDMTYWKLIVINWKHSSSAYVHACLWQIVLFYLTDPLHQEKCNWKNVLFIIYRYNNGPAHGMNAIAAEYV